MPPLVVHVHAALMVTWLLLLVTQASLVATGGCACIERSAGCRSVLRRLCSRGANLGGRRALGPATELGLGPFTSCGKRTIVGN
jgi:hypothetical protein